MDLARAYRRVQCLAVHVREHEDRARRGVLHDRRNQAFLIEGDAGKIATHAASSLGRIAMPRAASAVLSSPTASSRSWKIDAASPASAPVSVKSSTKCATPPAPPDAMTGTCTASATAATSERS